MGSFFSTPVAEPEHFDFDLPEWKLKEIEEEDKEFLQKYHEDNAAIREMMWRHNTRAKLEEEKFKGMMYRQNWSEEVQKLKEKYPRWTAEDMLNLRVHFEVFVEDHKYLLHFSVLNELLNVFQDDSSPERRRAMFDAADVHGYKAINFEEFLELMNNSRTPVPRAAGVEDHDEMMMLCAAIADAHPFKRMAYGLF